jgi:hypothetical protein
MFMFNLEAFGVIVLLCHLRAMPLGVFLRDDQSSKLGPVESIVPSRAPVDALGLRPSIPAPFRTTAPCRGGFPFTSHRCFNREVPSFVSDGEVVSFGLRVLQAVPSGHLQVCKVRHVLNRERAFETVGDVPPCRGLLFSSFAPSNLR